MKLNNRIIVLFIVLVFVFAYYIFYRNNYLSNYYSSLDSDDVVVTKYKLGTDKIKKIFEIKSQDEIEYLSQYVQQLKPLSPEENVGLALANEVIIRYGDNITIGIQLSEKSYCYYINKKENISGLSRMPSGLYDWVVSVLK